MNQQDFFSRYRFNVRTDKLGGGSFGTVYKAYDTVLDKEVAIKVSEVKVMGGKEFSLMDEFRAIENLPPHPNIANYEKVFTFDMPQGVYDYAIIQYYPHGNLKDLIKERKLTEAEKISVARQLLTGLAFLHQNRVVHRDLKPSNILIHIRNRDNGEEIIPKIADFGLSKIAEGGNSRFDNSFGGGTLEYSSPEQLMGRELRFNTDLWAYSVIVYELFTGLPLFAPQTQSTGSVQREKEIYDQILHGEIAQKLEALPEKWKKDMLSCLVKEPDKRVKSASELSIITDDGIEIEVPQQDVSTLYEGNTVVNQSYGGHTVIATEEKAAPQQKPEPVKPAPARQPAGKKKKKTIGFAIGGGVIAFAVAGWFIIQNPAGAEGSKTSVAKSDYAFYLKQGDSLSAANDVEGAKAAYEKALAIKAGDTLITNRLSKLKFQNAVAGPDSDLKAVDKSLVNEGNSSNLSVLAQLQKKYSQVRAINGGLYVTYDWRTSKNGLIDKDGNLLTKIKYNYISTFNNGLAMVSIGDNYGYIDVNGHEVIPLKYKRAGNFRNGIALVEYSNKCGFINPKGQVVIPLIYDSASDFEEGLCCVSLNGKYGHLNQNGDATIPLKYEFSFPFTEGLACVKLNGKYGFINKKNEVIIPFKYDWAHVFDEGISPAHLNGKAGYINTEGKEVVPLIYDNALPYNNGMGEVKLNGKTFYVDKQGNCIKDCP